MLCFLTLLVVEIDKRIKFHKVLGLEYMMKVKNYSNTEYLVKSWIMITFALIFFIIAFFPTLYRLELRTKLCRRFHNHREGPYLGLLLVESVRAFSMIVKYSRNLREPSFEALLGTTGSSPRRTLCPRLSPRGCASCCSSSGSPSLQLSSSSASGRMNTRNIS